MTRSPGKAEALRSAGLATMAQKASEGYYDDFLSPLATPALQLDLDLAYAARNGNAAAGEGDATEEESKAWAASPEGQEAMKAILTPKRKFRP